MGIVYWNNFHDYIKGHVRANIRVRAAVSTSCGPVDVQLNLIAKLCDYCEIIEQIDSISAKLCYSIRLIRGT